MNGKGNGKVDLGRKQFFPDDSKKVAKKILLLRCTHAPDVPEHTFSVTCNTAARFYNGRHSSFQANFK